MEGANLVLSHDTDETLIGDAIVAMRDLNAGFEFSPPELKFKSQEFADFIKELIEVYPGTTEYNYSSSKNSITKKYINKKFRLYISGGANKLKCNVYCRTENISIAVWELYNTHRPETAEVKVHMRSFYMERGYVGEDRRELKTDELKYVSPDYYPYIDTTILFDQFFTGQENILLMVGSPGLGKSKFAALAIKYALTNPDKIPYDKTELDSTIDAQFINVAYVKSTAVLVEDSFWRALESMNADFCIIDDLDYMLTKRDSTIQTAEDIKKNDFLNQFLSHTDGVEKHKTKFIITTNQRYDDIDSAVLRKGRLFDILELRELTIDESVNIWLDNGLDEADFSRTFTETTVLPAELGSEIGKLLNTRIDRQTALHSYIKESGISKIKQASRTKKIKL